MTTKIPPKIKSAIKGLLDFTESQQGYSVDDDYGYQMELENKNSIHIVRDWLYRIEQEESILKNGFIRNTKIINGFRPHFTKGNDVLFIIGDRYSCKRICQISHSYRNYPGRIFGIQGSSDQYTQKRDWVTAPRLELIKFNPFQIAQWNEEGNDIEFIKQILNK